MMQTMYAGEDMSFALIQYVILFFYTYIDKDNFSLKHLNLVLKLSWECPAPSLSPFALLLFPKGCLAPSLSPLALLFCPWHFSPLRPTMAQVILPLAYSLH